VVIERETWTRGGRGVVFHCSIALRHARRITGVGLMGQWGMRVVPHVLFELFGPVLRLSKTTPDGRTLFPSKVTHDSSPLSRGVALKYGGSPCMPYDSPGATGANFTAGDRGHLTGHPGQLDPWQRARYSQASLAWPKRTSRKSASPCSTCGTSATDPAARGDRSDVRGLFELFAPVPRFSNLAGGR